MRKSDVLIIGGGVTGASVAYCCARAGASVVLLERGQTGGGCSYGNAGLLAPGLCAPLAKPGAVREGIQHLFRSGGPFSLHMSLAPDFLRWLRQFMRCCNAEKFRTSHNILRQLCMEGMGLHAELARAAGDAYELDREGLLVLYRDATAFEVSRTAAEAMRPHGIELDILGAGEARAVEPGFRGEIAGGILFRTGGMLDPYRFVCWLAKEAEKAGAEVFPHTEALWLEERDGRIGRVVATGGEFYADNVVIAAGAWIPEVAGTVGLRLPVLGGKGYSLSFEAPGKKLRMPLLIDDARLAVTPFAKTLRVTGYLELGSSDPTAEKKKAESLRTQAEGRLRCLPGMRLKEVWRGFRPCTPDGVPIIGKVGRYRNLFVAGGHGTKGMLLGPVTGRYIARMLQGKPAGPLDAALSPDRFQS